MATVVTLAHRSVPDSLVLERTKATSEEAALSPTAPLRRPSRIGSQGTTVVGVAVGAPEVGTGRPRTRRADHESAEKTRRAAAAAAADRDRRERHARRRTGAGDAGAGRSGRRGRRPHHQRHERRRPDHRRLHARSTRSSWTSAAATGPDASPGSFHSASVDLRAGDDDFRTLSGGALVDVPMTVARRQRQRHRHLGGAGADVAGRRQRGRLRQRRRRHRRRGARERRRHRGLEPR